MSVHSGGGPSTSSNVQPIMGARSAQEQIDIANAVAQNRPPLGVLLHVLSHLMTGYLFEVEHTISKGVSSFIADQMQSMEDLTRRLVNRCRRIDPTHLVPLAMAQITRYDWKTYRSPADYRFHPDLLTAEHGRFHKLELEAVHFVMRTVWEELREVALDCFGAFDSYQSASSSRGGIDLERCARKLVRQVHQRCSAVEFDFYNIAREADEIVALARMCSGPTANAAQIRQHAAHVTAIPLAMPPQPRLQSLPTRANASAARTATPTTRTRTPIYAPRQPVIISEQGRSATGSASRRPSPIRIPSTPPPTATEMQMDDDVPSSPSIAPKPEFRGSIFSPGPEPAISFERSEPSNLDDVLRQEHASFINGTRERPARHARADTAESQESVDQLFGTPSVESRATSASPRPAHRAHAVSGPRRSSLAKPGGRASLKNTNYDERMDLLLDQDKGLQAQVYPYGAGGLRCSFTVDHDGLINMPMDRYKKDGIRLDGSIFIRCRLSTHASYSRDGLGYGMEVDFRHEGSNEWIRYHFTHAHKGSGPLLLQQLKRRVARRINRAKEATVAAAVVQQQNGAASSSASASTPTVRQSGDHSNSASPAIAPQDVRASSVVATPSSGHRATASLGNAVPSAPTTSAALSTPVGRPSNPPSAASTNGNSTPSSGVRPAPAVPSTTAEQRGSGNGGPYANGSRTMLPGNVTPIQAAMQALREKIAASQPQP